MSCLLLSFFLGDCMTRIRLFQGISSRRCEDSPTSGEILAEDRLYVEPAPCVCLGFTFPYINLFIVFWDGLCRCFDVYRSCPGAAAYDFVLFDAWNRQCFASDRPAFSRQGSVGYFSSMSRATFPAITCSDGMNKTAAGINHN